MDAIRDSAASLFGPVSVATRRLGLALGAILSGSALLLAAGATPAVAVVSPTIDGHQYGFQPQSEAAPVEPVTALAYGNGPVVHSSAPYAVYWDPQERLGEWEGLISGFLEGASNASGSLQSVFAVASQYRDASGNAANSSSFRGAYTDVDPFPGTGGCAAAAPCLSDDQIRAELAHFVAADELPGGLNPSSGPTPIYFIFTPPGTTVCLGGAGESGHCSTGGGEPLCSYHSFTSINGATVLYAVEPWLPTSACQDGTGVLQEPNRIDELGNNPGLGRGDVIINSVADEQMATITNPLLTAWHDAGGAKDEVPDKCRNEFEGGLFQVNGADENFNQTFEALELRNYYVNDEFDQAALFDHYPGHPCLNEVKVEPEFNLPSPVHSGEQVTFNATSSYVDLGVAKANWSFGDGTTTEVNCEGRTPTNGFAPAGCTGSSGVANPNSVASVVHHYTYGGSYDVALTVIDDGGNAATVEHTITVVGPAAPVPPAPPAPTPSSTSTSAPTTSGSTSASPSATPIVQPATGAPPKLPSSPVATQAVAPQKLSAALKSGLVVRYSVNEQVAGRFEVLLASSIARQLGLHGASAVGLAKGTPPQTVIAKAVLVTTKGGHSTYKLQFSKTTAARLRRLKKVSLMLRLIVRNASSGTTTVLNKLTLTS